MLLEIDVRQDRLEAMGSHLASRSGNSSWIHATYQSGRANVRNIPQVSPAPKSVAEARRNGPVWDDPHSESPTDWRGEVLASRCPIASPTRRKARECLSSRIARRQPVSVRRKTEACLGNRFCRLRHGFALHRERLCTATPPPMSHVRAPRRCRHLRGASSFLRRGHGRCS
jgi:hypothetical protein